MATNMPSRPSFYATVRDLIEHSIERERAIKEIKSNMTFNGYCSDLIISRKTISAIGCDLYTINELYKDDVARLGRDAINDMMFFHWQQDLIAAGVILSDVRRGELNGVGQQTLEIIKRLFPNISHWTGNMLREDQVVRDSVYDTSKTIFSAKDVEPSSATNQTDFEIRRKQWLSDEDKKIRSGKSFRSYKKTIIAALVIVAVIGLLFILPYVLNNNLISQVKQTTHTQVSNVVGTGTSIIVTAAYPQGSLENMILQKINQERANRGIPPLLENIKLDTAARRHCEDMAIRNFFDHTNPDGDGPNERAAAAGYPLTRPAPGGGFYYGVGENIVEYPVIGSAGVIWFIPFVIPRVAWYDNNAMADALVQSWMDSPGHRANILDPGYREIGIGCTWELATVYSTTDFG